MASRWDNKEKNNASSLLKEMRTMLNITKDGNISQKPYFQLFTDTLFGYVKHKKELSTEETFQVFEKTIKSQFRDNNLSKMDSILTEFDKSINSIAREKNEFKLLVSLEIDAHDLKSRTVNGVKINFYKSIPKRYTVKLTEKSKHMVTGKSYAVISVESPNKRTAIEKAMSSLDILRAIWHMLFKKQYNLLGIDNESKYWSRSLARLGQYHAIFDSNGEIVGDDILHIKNHINMDFVDIKEPEVFDKNITFFLNKLNRSKLKSHIENSLINYISAADTIELDSRFLKLSSTIESLLQSDTTKEIAKKLSFLYQDGHLESSIIVNLRNSRNELSHSCITPPNMEIKCYNLTLYIEDVIKFMMINSIKVNSIKEMMDFMLSPVDINVIEQQIKRLKLARKFLSAKGENA